MRTLLAFTVLATLARTSAADVLLTKSTHTNSYTQGAATIPERDGKQFLWFGSDRLRLEEGDRVTIVRLDLQKVYVLNTADKTSSTLAMPIDLSKAVSPEDAARLEQLYAGGVAKITATTETKKIGAWNATKHTFTYSTKAISGYESDIWTSNDVGLERATYLSLMSEHVRSRPGGAVIAEEMAKLGGVPVLVERRQKIGDQEVRSREEVVSVETKDAPAGAYELPATGYKDVPYAPFPAPSRAPESKPEKKPEPKKSAPESH